MKIKKDVSCCEVKRNRIKDSESGKKDKQSVKEC